MFIRFFVACLRDGRASDSTSERGSKAFRHRVRVIEA